MAHAYPKFIEGIYKFLGTTRTVTILSVTKGGFDWETIEPDNPWAYIGYWGDHQIIYLLKFLEFIEDFYPEKLKALYQQEYFVYANVPYRIKSYKEIVKDPKNTILFDHAGDAKIRQQRMSSADGALLTTHEEVIALVYRKMWQPYWPNFPTLCRALVYG